MPPAAQSVGSAGSGERWGPLWGARAADWALSEDRQTPTYEAALERSGRGSWYSTSGAVSAPSCV